ncbi:uncharacterized protein Z519_07146 [Cladophialophora bantiana CBS 173.52]|uniref:DASH complex subunit DUO1 n=1 Tax=Cladophialophora bantiana (strain ATCC 10958 / CBS 173.52 / CDC B-1940 / NIH 8579) TaxID=1442370 RepID=A0A0D2G097_CLAB1|nr:uncharacterized protein Z519_07146 [Cladophialophora bantiana CBS 173.52]KIW92162.1 hypothetical protein Z519_07146 [Cladophialophora bantiana CBS 173.52]
MSHNTSSLIDDELDESLWHAPAEQEAVGKSSNAPKYAYQEQEEYEESLRQELQSVRQANEAIEGVIQSLHKAKSNMKTVNNTVSAASSLLNTWTKILSQTEHNQRLILDPSWQGASQDIADIEEEAMEKKRAAERREAEQEERKRAAAKQTEEEERRRTEAATKPARATSRGTGRVGIAGRGTTASTQSSSYVQVGGSNSSGIKRGAVSSRRTASGLGRGAAGRASRGRG